MNTGRRIILSTTLVALAVTLTFGVSACGESNPASDAFESQKQELQDQANEAIDRQTEEAKRQAQEALDQAKSQAKEAIDQAQSQVDDAVPTTPAP
jgi:Flp pilus assembly protein TadB